MSFEEEIVVCPELSEEFKSFEEFSSDNSGNELLYFDVVAKNPLEMDAVTLAFSMRNLLRLSRPLMDILLKSLNGDCQPTLTEILACKGIELSKSKASSLRQIFHAFSECPDDPGDNALVKALQLMTIARERKNVILNLGETYNPPDEGWTPEDFGGDDSMMEAVRSVEDPRWNPEEGV